MNSGIYKWTNKETGNIYIGQAKNLAKRQKQFLNFNTSYAGEKINEERKNYPSLIHWNYDILEECTIEQLNIKEESYIEEYYKNGYNLLNKTFKSSVQRKYNIDADNILKPWKCPLSLIYLFNKKIQDNINLNEKLFNIIKLIHDPIITEINYDYFYPNLKYTDYNILRIKPNLALLNKYGYNNIGDFSVDCSYIRYLMNWNIIFKNNYLNMSDDIPYYPICASIEYNGTEFTYSSNFDYISVSSLFFDLTKKYTL